MARRLTSTVQNNLQARMNNAKTTIQSTIENGKKVIADVKTRFDLGAEKEPQNSKGLGGVFGQRGDLPDSSMAFVVREKDILANHVQNAASINRSWVRGS